MSDRDDTAPFYDDFRAEADELLTGMGSLLDGLEGAALPVRRERLRTFLRHVHTLKGLTGMVEADVATELAHLLESFLLEREDSAVIDRECVDLLAAATRDLRRAIESPAGTDVVPRFRELFDQARGDQSPGGDVEELVPELPAAVKGALTSSDLVVVEHGLSQGLGLSLINFDPSPELAERGITVNGVRDELSRRVELVKVVPCVKGQKVSFAFLCLVEEGLGLDDLEVTLEVVRPPLRRTGPVPALEAPSPARIGVRVDVERLDDVMRYVENLVVSRYRFDKRLQSLGLPREKSFALEEASLRMQRELRELTEAVVRVRLVPLADVFRRMPLVVRDLAGENGKQVELSLKGEETRLDKNLVEQLLDPLLHLVRNAMAHGLESPEERRAAGKPPTGRLEVAARADGNNVIVSIRDDGRGIPEAELRRRSANRRASLLELVCTPGLSSRKEAGKDAGRGMGMDIVRRAVEGMGGILEVRSRSGAGTVFTLTLPLTMAIVDVLIVRSSGQTFAIPQDVVDEIVELREGSQTKVRGGDILTHRDRVFTLFRLRSLLGLREGGAEERVALLYRGAGYSAALAVEEISGLREVVVRHLKDPLVARPWIAGAAELGDGRLVLILHLRALLERTA